MKCKPSLARIPYPAQKARPIWGTRIGGTATAAAIVAFAIAGAAAPQASAQNTEGQIIAAQYGQYRVPGTLQDGYVFAPAACQVSNAGQNFAAFTQGAPVRIVDGDPNSSETVVAGRVDIHACSVQLNPLHHHSPPFYLTSGTGGLQEAIIANGTGTQANTIVLDSTWYALGGSQAIIGSVQGSTKLGLVDVTQTPYVWYEWNGSNYVPVTFAGTLPSGSGLVKVTLGAGTLASSADIVSSVNISPTAQFAAALIPALPYQAPLGYTPAPDTTTVNGHPLSSNVEVSASDINTGTLPHAQLPALLSNDVPNNAANTSGNAGTATKLAAVPNPCTGPQFATGIDASGNAICGSPATGIPTLNGSTGAQTLTGAGAVSVSTVGTTTIISVAGGGISGSVGSFSQYQDAYGPNTGSSTAVGPNPNSWSLPSGLSSAQLNAILGALPGGNVLHINGPEPQFQNLSNGQVQDNRPGAQPWSVTNSGAACNAVLAFATVTAGSNVINMNSGYNFASIDAGDSGTNLGAKWISMVGLVSGIPTRFDAYITGVNNSIQATLSANSPFSASDYSVTVGNDDTAQLAQAVSYAHNGDARLSFPGNANTGGVCWSRTAPLALSGTPMTGLPNGGILGGAGLDTTQGASGNLEKMQFYVDARIDATHPWNWDNNGSTTAQTPMYRPVGIMTPSSNNPLGPGWIRGSEPYGYYAYNGVASTSSGSAIMCVLTSAGSVPPVGADIIFPYLTTVLHTTVASTAGSCGTGTPITLSAAIPQTVSQAEYFWGEAPGASPSGTAVQEIATAIPATGRTFPMIVNLKNPNNPEPGAESDFAPFGLVKIDGEEFQYYRTSSYPMVSGQWLQLTSGAQNGTSAAAHSIGAAIVPLNPFEPSLPWPVTTINGAGNQTPPGAEYYPAFNIGNAAISQPVPDGTGFGGAGGFSESHIVQNSISAWPIVVANAAENPYNFQSTNSTAGMYMVPLPFNSWFMRNNIAGPQFGIWEGGASQNNHDYIGLPTADTDVFDSNHISVGYAVGLVGGGTLGFTNNQLFSQNGPPNSGWYPFTPASGSGGAVCLDIIADGPDDTVGLGQGQYSWGSEVFDAQISGNNYCEAENPVGPGNLVTTQPIDTLDFNSTTWNGFSDMAGGTVYLGGTANHISGGPFTNGPTLPLIIDGSNETVDFVSTASVNVNAISNTWGTSPILAWGPNNRVTSPNASGGDGRMSWGNNTPIVDGQTNEFAATGNLTAPYVNSQGGFFTADMLNPVGHAGSAIGWTFDGTSMMQSYAGCAAPTGVNTVACSLFFNGRSGQATFIGPGQEMAAGKYIWTMGLRESSGSPQTFGAYASTSCGYLDQSHTNIPITTTWTNVAVGIIDYTGTAGCALQMTINGTSTSATGIEIAYISFVPLPQNLQAQQLTLPQTTPADNTACTPGAILGSDANYIYVCTGSGTVKRAVLASY